MSGHRRISTDLFLEHLDRSKPRTKVEALIELDLDDWKGERKSVRAYARFWRWSRDKVERLIAEYEAHIDDLNLQKRGDSRPATDRPETGHQSGQSEGHESEGGAQIYDFPPATESAADPATDRPETGHFLEPEPEPGGESAPPARPSARGVGAIDSRRRAIQREIELAAATVPDKRRDEAMARLVILAGLFSAAAKPIDGHALGTFLRATPRVPLAVFQAACDTALAESERGFITAHAINQAGGKLAAQARKRARRSD